MIRRFLAILLVLFSCSFVLVGCGGRSENRPPASVAAQLTIDNHDFSEVDVYLGSDYIGTVLGGGIVSFSVYPGSKHLYLDFAGDGLGLIDYGRISLDTHRETYVEINTSFSGLIIDIFFR